MVLSWPDVETMAKAVLSPVVASEYSRVSPVVSGSAVKAPPKAESVSGVLCDRFCDESVAVVERGGIVHVSVRLMVTSMVSSSAVSALL